MQANEIHVVGDKTGVTKGGQHTSTNLLSAVYSHKEASYAARTMASVLETEVRHQLVIGS